MAKNRRLPRTRTLSPKGAGYGRIAKRHRCLGGVSGLHVFARRVAVDIPSLFKALPTILLITAVLVGFTILLPLLGFPVASFLLLCAVFLILHYRYPIMLTLIAAGASFFLWFIFQKLIGLPLPSGTLLFF